MMTYLVSTDLDGTLLDHFEYSWQAAADALAFCNQHKIPVIFNTSKTQSEAKILQKDIGIDAPMIVENGSALILPHDFFSAKLDTDYLEKFKSTHGVTHRENQSEIIFGTARSELLSFIESTRKQYAWRFEGFNDWSFMEIADHTGLEQDVAECASNKMYSEPFVWNDSEAALSAFVDLANKNGYKVLRGGRFYHLQGNTDKAKPLVWLSEYIYSLYPRSGNDSGNRRPELICLGDNHNDIDMLNIADYPVCVRSPVADFPQLNTTSKIFYTEAEGPLGWNEAVLRILSNLN